MDFEQHTLKTDLPNPPIEDLNQPFANSPSNLATSKVITKKAAIINEQEINMRLGQRFSRTPFSTLLSGSVYSVVALDFLIAVTSLSYAPTIGLPRPSLVGIGKTFIVKDEVGGAATTTITVRSAGEETIDGAATATITTNYGNKAFYTDGANWFIK